jgi:hypothetical protein
VTGLAPATRVVLRVANSGKPSPFAVCEAPPAPEPDFEPDELCEDVEEDELDPDCGEELELVLCGVEPAVPFVVLWWLDPPQPAARAPSTAQTIAADARIRIPAATLPTGSDRQRRWVGRAACADTRGPGPNRS